MSSDAGLTSHLERLLLYLHDLQDDGEVRFDSKHLRAKLQQVFESIKAGKGICLPMVVSDFDATLTTEKSAQCHDVLLNHTDISFHKSDYSKEEFKAQLDESKNYHHSAGAWWVETHSILEEVASFSNEDIRNAVIVAKTALRSDYLGFFKLLKECFVPLLVISAGMTNVIEQVFELHGLSHMLTSDATFHIDSNEIVFNVDSVSKKTLVKFNRPKSSTPHPASHNYTSTAGVEVKISERYGISPPFPQVCPNIKWQFQDRLQDSNLAFKEYCAKKVFSCANPVCFVLGDRPLDFDLFKEQIDVLRLNIGFQSTNSLNLSTSTGPHTKFMLYGNEADNNVCDLIITQKDSGLDIAREVVARVLEWTFFVRKLHSNAISLHNNQNHELKGGGVGNSISKWDNYYIKAALDSSSPPWESESPFHFIERTFKATSIEGLPISLDEISSKSEKLKLIELGCGSSASATYIASLGDVYDVSAVDISRYAIQRAKLRPHGNMVSWLNCDLMSDDIQLFEKSNSKQQKQQAKFSSSNLTRSYSDPYQSNDNSSDSLYELGGAATTNGNSMMTVGGGGGGGGGGIVFKKQNSLGDGSNYSDDVLGDTSTRAAAMDVSYHHGYGVTKSQDYTEDRAIVFNVPSFRKQNVKVGATSDPICRLVQSSGGTSSSSSGDGNNGVGSGDRFTVMGVADGHGGSRDYARYVTAAFRFKLPEYLKAHSDDNDNVIASIKASIKSLHEDIVNERQRGKLSDHGGTTFSVVVIDNYCRPKRAYIANMGDSPVFILSKLVSNATGANSKRYRIKFRSNDHDGNNIAEQARITKLIPSITFNGQYLVLGSRQLGPNRGFGDYDFEKPHLYPNEELPSEGGIIGREPEVYEVDLDDDDVVIVSSDGLLEVLDKRDGSLGPGRDEEEICEDISLYMEARASSSSCSSSSSSSSSGSSVLSSSSSSLTSSSLAADLIERKIVRVVKSFMAHSKERVIEEGSARFQLYRKSIIQSMDNHVVVTHVINTSSIALKSSSSSSSTSTDSSNNNNDGIDDASSPHAATNESLRPSRLTNDLELDLEVRKKVEGMVRSLKIKEQIEASNKNDAKNENAYDKIPRNSFDVVFDMQCYQFLSKIDSAKYVRNIKNMLRLDRSSFVIVVAGADTQEETNSTVNATTFIPSTLHLRPHSLEEQQHVPTHQQSSVFTNSSSFSSAIESALKNKTASSSSGGGKARADDSDDGWSDDENDGDKDKKNTSGSKSTTAVVVSSTSSKGKGTISSTEIDSSISLSSHSSSSSSSYSSVSASGGGEEKGGNPAIRSDKKPTNGPDKLSRSDVCDPFIRQGFTLISIELSHFNDTPTYSELLPQPPPCFIAVFQLFPTIEVGGGGDGSTTVFKNSALNDTGTRGADSNIGRDDIDEVDIYS